MTTEAVLGLTPILVRTGGCGAAVTVYVKEDPVPGAILKVSKPLLAPVMAMFVVPAFKAVT